MTRTAPSRQRSTGSRSSAGKRGARAGVVSSVEAGRSTPARARDATPTIFISYRHTKPTADIARKLYEALVPPAETWSADVFMDEHDLEPAQLLDREIIAALDRTTHFVVLLTNAYWSSAYCRKEVARVVERFERGDPVRLLFVKAEELDPNHFTFDKDRTSGRINSSNPLVAKIGDVLFLGPFDDTLRLVRLEWENEARLSDQLAQLVTRLERVIDRPARA